MPDEYKFSLTEIAEMLVRAQGLHEGRWLLRVEFGLGAMNISKESKPSEFSPAAIVPIVSMGLVRSDDVRESNLVVDASEINPMAEAAEETRSKVADGLRKLKR